MKEYVAKRLSVRVVGEEIESVYVVEVEGIKPSQIFQCVGIHGKKICLSVSSYSISLMIIRFSGNTSLETAQVIMNEIIKL